MFPTSPLCGVRRCGSNGKQATLCPPLHWPTAENTPFCPGGCYTTPIFPHLWDSLSLLSNMDYSDSGTVSRVSCWMMTQATILPWTAHSWRRPPGCFHWPLLFIFIIVFFFFGFFKQVISRTFVWLRQRMSTGEESRRLDTVSSSTFHVLICICVGHSCLRRRAERGEQQRCSVLVCTVSTSTPNCRQQPVPTEG